MMLFTPLAIARGSVLRGAALAAIWAVSGERDKGTTSTMLFNPLAIAHGSMLQRVNVLAEVCVVSGGRDEVETSTFRPCSREVSRSLRVQIRPDRRAQTPCGILWVSERQLNETR